MITTTYRKLTAVSAALQSFYSQPQEYDLRILLAVHAEKIWTALEDLKKFRQALWEQTATKGNDDKLMIRSKEAELAYNTSIDEFQDREVSIDIEPITEEMLRSVKMSPLDHLALMRESELLK